MIETARLIRALALRAEPIGDTDTWQVDGGSRTHVVRGNECDCLDHAMRHAECKHRLAVRLAALDADLRAALLRLVSQPKAPSPRTMHSPTRSTTHA